MKTSMSLITLLLGLLIFGCQEAKEDAKNPLSEKDFYKTIGEEIPFETGIEWIDNYRQKAAASGRTEASSGYQVSASQISALLDSTADLVGVAFHYGVDTSGNTHIVLIPVDGTLHLWPETEGDRILLDANTGTEIAESTASAWTEKYKATHPSEVWYHFFGKNIFEDMRALPSFDNLDIEPGLNTSDLTPELLLLIWEQAPTSTGRTSTSYAIVYDASNACPPCATQ